MMNKKERKKKWDEKRFVCNNQQDKQYIIQVSRIINHNSYSSHFLVYETQEHNSKLFKAQELNEMYWMIKKQTSFMMKN